MRPPMIVTGIALAVIVVLLVVSQLVVPPIAEHHAESSLTHNGGSAHVELSAFPAIRLAFGEGSRLRVRANGITTAPSAPGSRSLEQLDGFDHVDVEVTDLHTGPLVVRSFALSRDGGDSPYSARMTGSVTPAALSTYAGGQVGGGLGGLIGGVAGGALPFANRQIPIDLQADVQSDDGRPNATAVSGTVAGVPAGPVMEALAAALAGRF